jgi:tubulin beta
MKSLFMRLTNQFGQLYKRRAFLHWYTEEGMDAMEFEEADKNVRDLVCEYQDKENAVYDEDDEAESDADY